MAEDISELLQKGGVYLSVQGDTAQDVYRYISQAINLPEEITPDSFCTLLCERENLLSTAVGNGIALPHSSKPIVKNPANECIAVCYLAKPIDMGAPDGRLVHVMFVLMMGSTQSHLHALGQLARYLQKQEFRDALEHKATISELITLMHTLK